MSQIKKSTQKDIAIIYFMCSTHSGMSQNLTVTVQEKISEPEVIDIINSNKLLIEPYVNLVDVPISHFRDILETF